MDPLCHTLTGLTLAQTGLKDKTALGTAALVIGANLPDIDVLAAGVSTVDALAFRRGWTHGALALVGLPLALAAGLHFWKAAVQRGDSTRAPRLTWLVGLSTIGVVSHYALDFLNVYGIRFLMPFSGRWFYGDTLFIADPWMWIVLAAGILLARRRQTRELPVPGRPARAALVAASAYVAVMMVTNVTARRIIAESAIGRAGQPLRIMAAPVLANPFRRDVVIDRGDRYEIGRFEWLPRPTLEMNGWVAVNAAAPAAARAAGSSIGQRFLTWARFPYFLVEQSQVETRVHIVDLRYARGPRSWAAVTVTLAAEP